MVYLYIWYISGLVGYIIINHIEAKIMTRDIIRMARDKGYSVYYAGGVPPFWYGFIIALLGLINLVNALWWLWDDYNYKNEGEK